ncbi:hypothetical protein CHE218_21030 [Microbacterium sp. che218]
MLVGGADLRERLAITVAVGAGIQHPCEESEACAAHRTESLRGRAARFRCMRGVEYARVLQGRTASGP